MAKRMRRRRGFRRTKSHVWSRARTTSSYAVAGVGSVLGINLIDPPDFMPITGLDVNKGLLYRGGHVVLVPHISGLSVGTEPTVTLWYGVYVGYDGAPTRDPRQAATADQEADWLTVGHATFTLPTGANYDRVVQNPEGGFGLHIPIKTKRRLQTNQQIVFVHRIDVQSGTAGINLGSSGFEMVDSQLVDLRGL